MRTAGERRARLALILLGALYAVALLVEPLAPYSADDQHRLLSYAPPTRLHLIDATGRWHLMPFVHPLETAGQDSYREVRSVVVPLRLLPRGAPYRLAGLFNCDRHLVGVDAPARLFLLGTDRYGRDVLSRLLLGARLSLLAGALATVLALSVGTAIGIVSGFYGGRLDDVLMTAASLFLSLPWVYLLIAARSMLPLDLPPSSAFTVVVVLIGLVAWARPARVIRGVALAARSEDYVAAARSSGAGFVRIIVRHLLPQASGVVLTQAALMAPACVLAEMTLSFLGLGLGEPTPSWGALAAGMLPPGLVLKHWWLAAPLAAMVPVFALYELAASAFARETLSSYGATSPTARETLSSYGGTRPTARQTLAGAAPRFGQVEREGTMRQKLPFRRRSASIAPAWLVAVAVGLCGHANAARAATTGVRGGQIVIAQRAEPKTFNPIMAIDAPSREVIRRLTADLIHINRQTLATEPALARDWSVSSDGRHYTVTLRAGLRFSDGHPCTADDVAFSFAVYLDERVHAPQRDLLMIEGKPIGVRKVDALTIVFDLPARYAAAERLFDSVAILPKHLLDKAYRDGTIGQAWSLSVPPASVVGLGPFRLARYVPGERVVLDRNPYYWKVDAKGQSLPYLDRLTFIQVADDNAQALRFQAGDTDLVTRLTADDYDLLVPQQRDGGYRVYDAGPGLEYNFLFFNLNDVSGRNLPNVSRKQEWFRERAFRQAVSAAIDRDSIVRLVYRGHGAALWGHVTPGNRRWYDESLPHPGRSLDRAKQLLRSARFSWDADGGLRDPGNQSVEFSILVAAGNQPRLQMATIIQDDLKQLGVNATVVPLEFRALLDRVLETRDYEACVLGLGSGDADPSAEMNVWLSSGPTHLWNPGQRQPATRWEAEIDDLMRKQFVVADPRARKRLYDRVQQIVAEELPIICLASPDILVGARAGLGNFRPAILDHYVLSNVDELYWRERQAGGTR